MSPIIALFGNRGSPQVMAVRQAILEEGGTPLIFDIQLGGSGRPTLQMTPDNAWWEGVDFRPIRAIHIRCTAPNTLPAVPPRLDAVSHAEWRTPYLREQGFQAATFSFFQHLVQLGKLVVNPLTLGYPDHDSKGQLAMRLAAAGFPVPHTLTTNNPDSARQFLAQQGELVVKPAIGVGSTRVVTADDEHRLEDIARCPVLLQERIHGQTLRVHIVGDQVVLALRIFSEGGVDSRTQTHHFEAMHFPEDEARRLVAATRFLGLHFAAWDVIEDRDGGIRYLDCNPGPFVMWIGETYVQHVFRQLARFLLTFAHSGELDTAARCVQPLAL